jgi:hypothetical protein
VSNITTDDILESLAILKAQQNADTEVIKCLLVAAVGGTSLSEAWRHQVPVSVVEEQLFAQSSELAKRTLDAFTERLDMWGGIIKSLSDD